MSKKSKKNKQKNTPKIQWKLPLLFYIAALALYLLGCTYSFVQDHARTGSGAIVQQQMYLEDFTLQSIKVLEGAEGTEQFVSTDNDPQMIYYNPRGVYITRLVFNASPNKAGGEMVLYYTTAANQSNFTETQKLWARQAQDGSWYFDLGGKKIYALRLDPDTAGGVVWTVQNITLNPPKTFWAYFFPTAQPVFLLLLLPGLAAAVFAQGQRVWRLAKASRP